MTRADRTALPLPWAFVGSLLLHVGLIAPVGMAIMHSDAGGIAPLRGTVDLSIVEPPPPPEHEEQQLDLGIENGAPSSLNWIGFEEYQKHLALLSETEQPALGTLIEGPELVEGAPVPIAEGGASAPSPAVAAAAVNPPSAPTPPAQPTPQAIASTNDPLMPKADAGGTLVTTTPPPPQPPTPLPTVAIPRDVPPALQPDAGVPGEAPQPAPPPRGDLQIPEAVREPGLLGHGSEDHSVAIAPPNPPPTPATAPAADAPDSVASEVTTEATPTQPETPKPPPARPDAPVPLTPPSPLGPPDPTQSPEPLEPTSPLHPADAPTRAGSIKDDPSAPAPAPAPEPSQQPAAATPPPSPEPAPALPSAAPPSSSAPPSQPAAPAQSPAPGAGLPSDKESDATSVIDVPRNLWQNGKPLAAKGLELKPRRPQFTTLMRVTSAPGNPVCLIQFGRDGKPVSARLLRSTGDSQVDEVIFNSLYGWRASGQQLKTLRDDQTIDIVLRLILIERPD